MATETDHAMREPCYSVETKIKINDVFIEGFLVFYAWFNRIIKLLCAVFSFPLFILNHSPIAGTLLLSSDSIRENNTYKIHWNLQTSN